MVSLGGSSVFNMIINKTPLLYYWCLRFDLITKMSRYSKI